MTTFYPNALSGFVYALNIKFLYPIIAFLIFLGFLMAYRDSIPHCIFLGVVLSMFLFPTPEPQFLSSIFVIMLWTKLIERQRRDSRTIEDQPECQLNSKMDCIA
jgi:ABC-type Mn2+/Zn2+ transport system permease subunit